MIYKCIKFFLISSICLVMFTGSNICAETVTVQPASVQATSSQGTNVKPLDIVNNPKLFLNKTIELHAKFDKFSTLGLDYKPAFKSSDDYISFLIMRDDTTFDIPLSEMKLFLKRDYAEKFIELKTKDEIKITGTVFSDALGDAWINVENITVIKKAPEKDGVK